MVFCNTAFKADVKIERMSTSNAFFIRIHKNFVLLFTASKYKNVYKFVASFSDETFPSM